MDLLTFLVVTIVLCGLIMLVQGGENKSMKYLAVACIIVEVFYLLLIKGVVDPSLGISLEQTIPCLTGVVGLSGLFKMSERSIPLLIFFASLLQFFVEMDIIQSVG